MAKEKTLEEKLGGDDHIFDMLQELDAYKEQMEKIPEHHRKEVETFVRNAADKINPTIIKFTTHFHDPAFREKFAEHLKQELSKQDENFHDAMKRAEHDTKKQHEPTEEMRESIEDDV